MYTLQNEHMIYSLDEMGNIVSIYNKETHHQYVKEKGDLFRLIYAIDDFDERSINGNEQNPPKITVVGNEMRVYYNGLASKNGHLDIKLTIHITLDKEKLSVYSDVVNNSDAELKELQTTAFSGICSLGDNPEDDTLIIPRSLGQKIPNPTEADFYSYVNVSGRKYERPDHIHTDINIPYPGYCSMKWFSLYNKREAIYVAEHGIVSRIICMHIEKMNIEKTLKLGMCQYLFLKKGEKTTTPPVVYALLEGDWHSCADYYRKWIEKELNWKPSQKPEWIKEFQGWLRVIFRTQSGEFNFHFKDIPKMFDEVQDAGLNTLFILGWPKGGFARMRPDYIVNPEYMDDLKSGIEYVHSKGGKVVMFVSYRVVDKQSDYFLNQNGSEVLIKDIWDGFVSYSETYSVDGSYRKVLNMPKAQYSACSGSDRWHEKMKEAADYCLSLGADAVLYDLGATRPLLCNATNHDHDRPDEARVSRAERFKDLRKNIKAKGDFAIMQEHCVDVYTPFMDLVQPNAFLPRDNSLFPEMFLYTFPEVIMTNRENAMDEDNMYDNINNSFIFNLRFDLSIARCCATPASIPNYCKYMKNILNIRNKYRDYLVDGIFVDEVGFETDGVSFKAKGYLTKDKRLGVAIWNYSQKEETQEFINIKTGKKVLVTLDEDSICFIEL